MKRVMFILFVAACAAIGYAPASCAAEVTDESEQDTTLVLSESLAKQKMELDLAKVNAKSAERRAEIELRMKSDRYDHLTEYLAVSSPFLCIAVVVFFVFYFGYKRKRAHYELLAKMVECHVDPKEVERYMELTPEKERKSGFQSALTLIFIGVAIFLIGLLLDKTRICAAISLIPFLIGVSRLIGRIIERRQNERKATAEDEPER